MDPHIVDVALKAHLKELRVRLEQASGIVRAAEACAETGSVERGIELALEIEPMLFEARTLLQAANMMQRMWKSSA